MGKSKKKSIAAKANAAQVRVGQRFLQLIDRLCLGEPLAGIRVGGARAKQGASSPSASGLTFTQSTWKSATRHSERTASLFLRTPVSGPLQRPCGLRWDPARSQ